MRREQTREEREWWRKANLIINGAIDDRVLEIIRALGESERPLRRSAIVKRYWDLHSRPVFDTGRNLSVMHHEVENSLRRLSRTGRVSWTRALGWSEVKQ